MPLVILGLALAGCATAALSSSTNSAVKSGIRSNSPPAGSLAKAHAHYAVGVLHERAGNPDLASVEFFQAALLDPTNESLTLEVSQLLLARKQLGRALELLEPAATRLDASGTVLVRLGYTYVLLGRWDDAIAINRRAIKRAPMDLSGYQNLYLNLLQNNQRAEALRVLQQAADVRDADADFLINLAELFVNYGRLVPAAKADCKATALKVLDHAAKLAKSSPELWLKLADGFNTLGSEAQAMGLYLQLVKDFSESPQIQDGIRARLADLQVRTGERKGAIVQLRALAESDPVNVAILSQLGDLAQDELDFQLAEESFRKVVLLRPELESAYYELAQAQIALAKSREALATLDQARQKFAVSFVGELLAGVAYGRLKEYDQAITSFIQAESVARISDPKRLNEGFYYQFGAVYERKGDFAQAEGFMRKSLELAPDFAEAQNYLGYMWAERGTNLDEARKLIEKAVRAEPASPAYLDSLAWVLFKLNRPKEALPHMLKAIELTKEPDATLFDHLGDIQAALGQPARAREAWKKSLAVEPNPAIQKKLDSTPAK